MSFIPVGQVEPVPVEAGAVEMPALPELRGIIGHFPDGLGAFDQMYRRMVGQGRLEPTLRLVILGASARWRSDGYISGAMFSQAMQNGLAAEQLAALIDEVEGGAAASKDGALLAFCRKATEDAFKMVQSDIDALQAHGWTNGQIVEATTMVSLSGYMTVLSAGGGLLQQPNLEPEPWR